MSDDNVVPFGRPGAPRSTGAVIDAYVDCGALERACPSCKQPVGEFCVHPGGVERKLPCWPRSNPKGRK